jgi:hypothetical protein
MSLSCNILPRISVLILVTLILSLVLTPAPVTATDGVPPSLEIDPHPTITATVSTQFSIQIWIRNIPEGYSMTFFDLHVSWDPTQMELVSHQEFVPLGKIWNIHSNPMGEGVFFIEAEANQQSDYTDVDMAWASFTFHCLSEGSSKIALSSPIFETVTLFKDGNFFEVNPASFEVICNQVPPRPVGGIVMPTDKLAIMTPYLALAGLVIAVSAIVVVKRRRD